MRALVLVSDSHWCSNWSWCCQLCHSRWPIFHFLCRRSAGWGIRVGSCCWAEYEVIVFIKSLCLPEPTFPPPDGHFANQSSLRLMKSTFFPSCWLLSVRGEGLFCSAHNVPIDDDQASAHRASYSHECQKKTHLWKSRGHRHQSH